MKRKRSRVIESPIVKKFVKMKLRRDDFLRRGLRFEEEDLGVVVVVVWGRRGDPHDVEEEEDDGPAPPLLVFEEKKAIDLVEVWVVGRSV